MSSETARSYPDNGSVGVTLSGGFGRTLWSLGEAAASPTLKNVIRHQPRPAGLVGSTKPPSVIAVEILEGNYGEIIASLVGLHQDTS